MKVKVITGVFTPVKNAVICRYVAAEPLVDGSPLFVDRLFTTKRQAAVNMFREIATATHDEDVADIIKTENFYIIIITEDGNADIYQFARKKFGSVIPTKLFDDADYIAYERRECFG